MGIYYFYELGVWFESAELPEYVRQMMPKKLQAKQFPELASYHSQLYFVACVQVPDDWVKGFSGRISQEEKVALLRLWKHVQQTKGFKALRVACVYYFSDTYHDGEPTRVEELPVMDFDLPS